MSFQDAFAKVRATTVFTGHTRFLRAMRYFLFL